MPQQPTDVDRTDKVEVKMVKVRNNSRRSLLVKVPGQAIHLQPGASAEVPRAYVSTEELATLVRSGAVLVLSPPAIPSGAGKAAPAVAPAAAPMHRDVPVEQPAVAAIAASAHPHAPAEQTPPSSPRPPKKPR